MENSRVGRARGPYKRWMNDGNTTEVPRTTKWRRMLLDSNEDFSQSCDEPEEQAAQNSYTEDEQVLDEENHMLPDLNQSENTEQCEENDYFHYNYGELDIEGNTNYEEEEQNNDGSDSFFGTEELENEENVNEREEQDNENGSFTLHLNEWEITMNEYEEQNNDGSDSFLSTEELENEENMNEEEEQDNENHSSLNPNDLENDSTMNEEKIRYLDKPLYESCKFTLGQCLLLLMSFILGNSLTASAVTDMLKLLALLLPTGNLLPDTKFLFDKYFNQFRKGTNLHLYCPECHKGLGMERHVHCEVCDVDYSHEDLVKRGCFFVYLPLKDQLLDLLQRPDITSKLDHRFSRVKNEEHNYEDIYDGEMYKQIANGKLMSDPNALSVSFNCDGVPIFKSSNYSIWPLQGILNELPPKERKDNVFLIALWFGSIKPVVSTFLEPFTDEMKVLGSTGLHWVKSSSEFVVSTVHACVCSADSVARCILQNIKQFNGLCGCNWCCNPGEVVAKGRGNCRVYPFNEEGEQLRTHASMVENARKAFDSNGAALGVKGPTRLVQLPEFDLVSGFVVDNLHCIDLGVTRQLGHLWFESSNHQEPWYIGNKISSVDKRLNLIHPPNEITRIPRSVNQRRYWKGSEWHWWLMLYSPVVLFGILPEPFYSHLLLLIEATFLLTSSSISCQDLNKANACLFKFVCRFEELYGKQNMTYNVHQLLHVITTVTNWGPLSNYSSYIFEGFNMVLLKLFHGTQAVPKQIANSFLLYKGIIKIASTIPRDLEDDPVSTYVNAVLNGCTPLKKSLKLHDNVTFLGAHYVRPLTLEERFLVEELFNELVKEEALIFCKAVLTGLILYSMNYRRTVRRNNYTVELIDGSIVEITNFAVVTFENGEKESIAFAHNVFVNERWLRRSDSDCGYCCSHIKLVNEREENLRIVKLTDVAHKYAVIESGHSLPGKMICKLPNLIDRD